VTQAAPTVPRLEGRYVISDEIAAGGTATVHFGRLLGHGFARTVAIKRLHPTYARDPVFVSMFLDEARLATRIRHPNVCAVLDVLAVDDEPHLVLDYVHGEPLAKLIDAAVCKGELVPYDVAAGIVCGMLQGLHAAHEAIDESGNALNIIHRDISPQNVLVGTDGVPRVIDFGMAKAMGRLQNTAEGQLKGKVGYMAPEQFALKELDRRVDVYSAAVVLWETLTGEFLFERTAPGNMMRAILEGEVRHASAVVPEIPAELDAVCMRALSRDPDDRFATAHEMAVAIESAILLPSPREIGAWVEGVAGDVLRTRAKVLARIEAEHPSATSMVAVLTNDRDEHPSPGASRKRAVVIGLAFVTAISLIWYFVLRDPRDHRTLAAEPPRAAASAWDSPPAGSTGEPPEERAEAPAPPASSEPEPTPVESAAPIAVPPRTPRRSNCYPPYTVDADGIRHPKRECLRLNPAR